MVKIVLILALVIGLAACGDTDTANTTTTDSPATFTDSSTMILDSTNRVDSMKMQMDTVAGRP